MTDKQIIIDGVDVSWCKHYKHNDKNSGWSSCTSKDEEHIHVVNPLCCEKKDCYYKQLKRKEQECNRYKQTLSEIQQDLEFATYCESQECGCDDANECLECTKKQILQKISEVKNE